MQLEEAIFIGYKDNRFEGVVNYKGQMLDCHISSTSKLNKYIEIDNKPCLIYKNQSGKYTLFAIKHKDHYVIVEFRLLNSLYAQTVISKPVCYEKYIEGYKSDVFVEDTNSLLEIKAVLSKEEVVIYPDKNSDRIFTQIKKLISLSSKYEVNLILLLLSPTIREVKFNKELKSLIKKGLKKGLKVKVGYLYMNKDFEIIFKEK